MMSDDECDDACDDECDDECDDDECHDECANGVCDDGECDDVAYYNLSSQHDMIQYDINCAFNTQYCIFFNAIVFSVPAHFQGLTRPAGI